MLIHSRNIHPLLHPAASPVGQLWARPGAWARGEGDKALARMELSSQRDHCSHMGTKHRHGFTIYLSSRDWQLNRMQIRARSLAPAPLLPALHMFFPAKTPSQTFHYVLEVFAHLPGGSELTLRINSMGHKST